MLARAVSFAIEGISAQAVRVEVDVRNGLPTLSIVGLGSVAVRETRERLRAAIANSGYQFPRRRVIANLAPAHILKAGGAFDLALACATLVASGQIRAGPLSRIGLFAELSLSGELRPSPGALAAAENARDTGLQALIVAPENADEAAQVGGLRVAGVASLRAVSELLAGMRSVRLAVPVRRARPAYGHEPDLADVRGQRRAVFALMVAAAGGHHLLLVGPPGVGKTMLARRLPSLLPPLSRAEAVEVTKIHSIAGEHREGGLIWRRPFRMPHPTTSALGLVGGGALAAPGEVALAHRGVLFLDELSEFPRSALDALRGPLEDGRVAVVRRQRVTIYPTRFLLVAASNPCPCGFAGDTRRCRCSEADMRRFRRRLSGPWLDRIDLVLTIGRPGAAEMRAPPLTSSARAAALVLAARRRQVARSGGEGVASNSLLDGDMLRSRCRIDAAAERTLAGAYDRGSLGVRGHVRVLRVARTIADLSGSDSVRHEHVAQALDLYRDIARAPPR